MRNLSIYRKDNNIIEITDVHDIYRFSELQKLSMESNVKFNLSLDDLPYSLTHLTLSKSFTERIDYLPHCNFHLKQPINSILMLCNLL